MSEKIVYHIDNNYISKPLELGKIKLVQIGRRIDEPSSEEPLHNHQNWVELTVFTGGQATVYVDGKRYSVQAGDVFLSLPYETHGIFADCDVRAEYDFFSFTCEKSPYVEEMQKLAQACQRGASRIFQDERVAFLVSNAISELTKPDGEYMQVVLQNALEQILVYVIRLYANQKREKRSESAADLLCFQMMSYIDAHVYTLNGLSAIADDLGYNYSYLSAVFKKTCKQSLFSYYQNRRLEIAKRLVLEKQKKISEIAELLGYSSPFAFTKAFKEKYGVSPKLMQSQTL